MAKRDELLASFLENPMLREVCDLTDQDLKGVNFSKNTGDALVESLKRMISSSADEDPPLTVVKSVNTVLERHLQGDK